MKEPLLDTKNLRQLIIGIIISKGDIPLDDFKIPKKEETVIAIKIADEIMSALKRTECLHPNIVIK